MGKVLALSTFSRAHEWFHLGSYLSINITKDFLGLYSLGGIKVTTFSACLDFLQSLFIKVNCGGPWFLSACIRHEFPYMKCHIVPKEQDIYTIVGLNEPNVQNERM